MGAAHLSQTISYLFPSPYIVGPLFFIGSFGFCLFMCSLDLTDGVCRVRQGVLAYRSDTFVWIPDKMALEPIWFGRFGCRRHGSESTINTSVRPLYVVWFSSVFLYPLPFPTVGYHFFLGGGDLCGAVGSVGRRGNSGSSHCRPARSSWARRRRRRRPTDTQHRIYRSERIAALSAVFGRAFSDWVCCSTEHPRSSSWTSQFTANTLTTNEAWLINVKNYKYLVGKTLEEIAQ